MTQSPFFIEIDPTEIYLEIPPETQARQQTQRFSTAGRSWYAYLNQLCLDVFLEWLRQAYPQAKPWIPSAHYPSVWEIVNGSAITLIGHTADPRHKIRLVLIPSAAIDFSELLVPQEWVDLPSWAGDYYLAGQVELDQGWMRIWGFTTHERLNQLGEYDAGDRTYSMDANALIKELDVLWDAQQLCPDEPTRASLQPLPALPLAQAQNLIARLGNPEVLLPQIEVPFTLWGALLENAGWRQQLYQRRVGLPEQWSVPQWLSSGVSQLAQHLGWSQVTFQRDLPGARGTELSQSPISILSRQLIIAGQSYELRVIPQGDLQTRIWRFELLKSATDLDPMVSQAARIPKGTKLRLLTEGLQTFENNEATATTSVERLYVVVALEPGEGLVWEVDPVPDNYEREILRF